MVNKASRGIAPLNRQLTEQECEVLTWLLEHGVPGAPDFVSQIPRLSVVGKCTCGCPTLYFALDGVPVKRNGEQGISDYIAELDGHPIGLMVFQTNGLLSSLEAYSLPGNRSAICSSTDQQHHRPSRVVAAGSARTH